MITSYHILSASERPLYLVLPALRPGSLALSLRTLVVLNTPAIQSDTVPPTITGLAVCHIHHHGILAKLPTIRVILSLVILDGRPHSTDYILLILSSATGLATNIIRVDSVLGEDLELNTALEFFGPAQRAVPSIFSSAPLL